MSFLFFYILHLLAAERKQYNYSHKEKYDKIGLVVSLRVSFPFMSFALPFIPNVTYGI